MIVYVCEAGESELWDEFLGRTGIVAGWAGRKVLLRG